MKKYTLITLILLIVPFFTYAQKEPTNTESENYLTQGTIKVSKDSNYKGSHYANDNFVRGTVYKGQKPVAANVGIRYNAYRDEMEIKENLNQPDISAKVMLKSPDIYVRIANEVFVYLPLDTTGMKSGYFQVYFEGTKFELYKKITKDFLEGFESANSYTRDVPAVYKQKENFFLHVKDTGVFMELPSSKRKKLDAFGSLKKQVKNYTKDEDLNINREKDLIKAVEYADGL